MTASGSVLALGKQGPTGGFGIRTRRTRRWNVVMHVRLHIRWASIELHVPNRENVSLLMYKR